MSKHIVAILGSYRHNGATRQLVEAMLDELRQRGAQTTLIDLAHQEIAFCSNCRACTQQPGTTRGTCTQKDDMQPILDQLEAADALILASPVNYWNCTALFRRFLERLICYAWWPWGNLSPKPRQRKLHRPAILLATAAMPGFMIPLATGAPKALRLAANSLGAKVSGKLWIGLTANQPQPGLSPRILARARRLAATLA